MKINLFICFLFITTNSLYAQDTLRIEFCEEFRAIKHSKLIRLSVIYKQDTILFPYLGDNNYLNPIQNIPIEEDSLSVNIILENCKYYYPMFFYIKDFELGFFHICVGKKKNKFGKVQWDYTNFRGRNLTGFGERIKK